MGRRDTRLPDGSRAAAPTDLMLEAPGLPSAQIGVVVRARKGLRIENGILIGVRDGNAEVVWPSGELVALQWSRIKEALTGQTDEVRSVPGRLMSLLSSKSAEQYLTDPARLAIERRLDELTQRQDHAVGLLLDRRALALSFEDCLALPLEPWRVRYQFLADGGDSAELEARLVGEIVADGTAPDAVRTRVALAHSHDVSSVNSEAALIFCAAGSDVSTAELAAAALVVGEALAATGAATASRLKTAARAPVQLAPSAEFAAVLGALEGRAPAGRRVRVSADAPVSVVDDLIDGGLAIEITEGSATAGSSTNDTSELVRYFKARLDPQSLTSEDVLALQFGSEAVRRYLAGDESVRAAIPRSRENDVEELRSIIAGGATLARASDPQARPLDRRHELSWLLSSPSGRAPSESLLSDRSVWHVLIDAGVAGVPGEGELAEKFAAVSSLSRAVRALYEWRWDEARSIAKDGLRAVRREDVRDELLNIIACALWLQGDTEPALAALDSALEGEYTDALLVNASVVASELEHFTARERLVRIAREAPSAHQRAMAAERALILWINDGERVWEEDDEKLPVEIRDALRLLIRENLPEDRYLRILKVLANHDDDWLASRPDSAFGPHANSASTRIFKARATGLVDFAQALTAELTRGDHNDWVARERDSVVEAAIEVLFERNDELSAAIFGLTLIDAGLPMPPEQRVPLRCLTVTSIAANIDEESEPQERFISFVVESHAELVELIPEDRERFARMVNIAAEQLAAAYFRCRYNEFDEAIDAYNAVMGRIQTIPSRNLNRQAVREAFGPISRFCSETWDIFNRLLPYLEDEKLTEAVVAMMSQASDMGNRIAAVTR